MSQRFVLEVIEIGEEEASFVNKMRKDIFKQWRSKGHCQIIYNNENQKFKKCDLRLELVGATIEENSSIREHILDVFEEAQARRAKDEERPNFPLSYALLFPEQKTGYLIGTRGETIRKLQEKFNSKVQVDSKELAPEGFSRVIVRSNQVTNLRAARKEILQIVEIASNLNQKSNGTGNWEEQIKIPASHYFSEEHRQKLFEIETSMNVHFYLGESNPDDKVRSLTLCGNPNNVLLAKSRIGELVRQIKEELETEDPPSPPLPAISTRLKHSSISEKSGTVIAPSDPAPQKRYMPTYLPYEDSINVPHLVQPIILGNRGEKIKQLQTKFGVRLIFLGENHLEYPNGRTLLIRGSSGERVQRAKKHIDEEFILSKWNTMNTNQRDFNLDEGLEEEMVSLDIRVTQSEELMMDMQKKSGIKEYSYKAPRPGNIRPVVLRGTKEAIAAAKKELALLSSKLTAKERVRRHSIGSISSFADTELDSGLVKNQYSARSDQQGRPEFPVPFSISAGFSRSNGILPYERPDLASNRNSYPKQQNSQKKDRRSPSVNSSKSSSSQKTIETQKPISLRHKETLNQIYELLEKQQIEVEQEEKSSRTEGTLYRAKIAELESENAKLMKQLKVKDEEMMRHGTEPCIVCNTARRSIMVLPCRHVLFCEPCSKDKVECPFCQERFVKKLELRYERE